MGIKLHVEDFIKRAKEAHGDFYDYSKVVYEHSNSKVKIICPLHGEFLQTPINHTHNKHGCKTCGYLKNGRKSNTNEFVEKARKRHGDLFDYHNCIYGKDNKQPVIITCKIHGDFKQKPNAHLNGYGCPKCKNMFNNFSKSGWINKAKGRVGIFYIIKCYNETESFYKIGITFNTIKKRYRTKKEMPYKFEIIFQRKQEDLSSIWDLERKVKRSISNKLYIPKIPFGGSESECIKTLSDFNMNDIVKFGTIESFWEIVNNSRKQKELNKLKEI